MSARLPLGRPLGALAQWLVLGALVGVACGAASALFLWLLDLATRTRGDHRWLVYLLPASGLVIGVVYARLGAAIRGGNNLVIDTLHDDTLRDEELHDETLRDHTLPDAAEGSPQLPVRMAPMVLVGTVLTHLFGGSAGREGTAVQMGASLADLLCHRLHLRRDARRELLAAGIAGGFGSVFGTPIAGLLFGLEVVCVGRIEYAALVPALVAALVGDQVTRALGIVHTRYPQVASLTLGPLVIGKWLVFGVAVALVSVVFIESVHGLKRWLERVLPSLPLRMMLGGAAVVGLWQLVGTDDYLGLGVPMILRAFTGDVPSYAFALKLLFTVITLAAGFLGGEVTPLFFVGATLGAVLARGLGLPVELAAGVGLAALFGAAANTPIALSIMAVELLGAAVLPHVVIVTVVAYLLGGHRGLYPSQRIARRKHGGPLLVRALRLHEIDATDEPPPPHDPV